EGPYATRPYSRRPLRKNTQTGRDALRRHADEWALAMRPLLATLQSAGFVKPAAVAAELNRRNIATARGEPWTESVVKHLRYRLQDIAERNGQGPARQFKVRTRST